MAKTKISEYSSTSASNTDVSNINIDEGCSPSGINNAIRTVMGHLKDFQVGSSGDSLTVGGNLSVTGTSSLAGAATAPTPATADNSTNVATTAYVKNNITALGLGTIATQNAGSVAITGGTIAGTFTGNITGNVTGNVSGNAGTVTNGVYTTNFSGSNQSLSTNGYQKFPSGLVMQWGNITVALATSVAVTFPIAFSNAVLHIQVSDVNINDTSGAATSSNIRTLGTTTGFEISTYTSSDSINWFALGY